ncbi:FkbM family methyltransferase [Marinobacter sp. X15-166B]|uniref:FkbM family methyltransferase n=1 Tax=Marinobacter sp. X15-166B TaxID=1897620 RepID=UPI00085C4F38|nr:FkbM family methyltransferase [Marinobacter sp. X15-166B]OEY67774.1 hypothetical protein BG841_15960 [Marinobacter sp. X15-166B]
MLRNLTKKLPNWARNDLKRLYYRRQIKQGTFVSPEIEFRELDAFIKPGDWVIDVGANVGHYTRRFSALVKHGRVIALEPHPQTFALLASNVADLHNVTLINAALSDTFDEVGFSIPDGNPYQAAIDLQSSEKVATVSPSALGFNARIAFIKLDVEGHEPTIIDSMDELIRKHRPVLMVENSDAYLKQWSEQHGYQFRDFEKSHNHILEPGPSAGDPGVAPL